MKSIKVVAAILVAIITSGCGEVDRSRFNQTFFPTNHWVVVGQGTNGQVTVETISTNLLTYLRVHSATAVVPMTNGQPARVEMTIRWNPDKRVTDIISSKAFPAME